MTPSNLIDELTDEKIVLTIGAAGVQIGGASYPQSAIKNVNKGGSVLFLFLATLISLSGAAFCLYKGKNLDAIFFVFVLALYLAVYAFTARELSILARSRDTFILRTQRKELIQKLYRILSKKDNDRIDTIYRVKDIRSIIVAKSAP